MKAAPLSKKQEKSLCLLIVHFQKLVGELVVYPDGGQHLDVRKTPRKRYAEKYRIHAQRAYADFLADGF